MTFLLESLPLLLSVPLEVGVPSLAEYSNAMNVLSCVFPNPLKRYLICYYCYHSCVCVYRHTCTMARMWRTELVFSFHFMV